MDEFVYGLASRFQIRISKNEKKLSIYRQHVQEKNRLKIRQNKYNICSSKQKNWEKEHVQVHCAINNRIAVDVTVYSRCLCATHSQFDTRTTDQVPELWWFCCPAAQIYIPDSIIECKANNIRKINKTSIRCIAATHNNITENQFNEQKCFRKKAPIKYSC